MQFDGLMDLVGRLPVFHASLLQAGDISERALCVQLCRWVRAGKLIQLRRGVYALAPPYRQTDPHPFLVAQSLRRNSYVSLQSALAYYGLIPEQVVAVTSVTTGRTEEVNTDIGSFIFRHVAPNYFFGYSQTTVVSVQQVFVASREKALLDLLYLTPGGEREDYLRELRLQNLKALRMDALENAVNRMGKPKLTRALKVLKEIVLTEEANS
jgi:predicted transcriptional regulator of viral defense system